MDYWNISQAKAKFAHLVLSSEKSPQIICNRGNPVSALIHIDLYNELMAVKEREKNPTIAELLDELKAINESEPVEMDIPERKNRPNPFEEEKEELDKIV